MIHQRPNQNIMIVPGNHASEVPYSLFLQPDFQRFLHQNRHFLNLKCCQQGKGRWTDQQQDRYVRFLIENEQQMREKMLRKSKKVFLLMSKVIKTRTPDQCRSHHQKVLNIHKSLDEIIRYHQAKTEIFGSKGDSEASKQVTRSLIPEISISNLYVLTKNGNHFRFQIIESEISTFI